MLRIGRLNSRSCNGWTRRELLTAGGLTALGMNLADLTRMEARGEATASGRSVILLWLWGGPSHLDTFDLKPEAPLEYRGPYQPISTRVPGFDVCELLPELASRSDRYSVIRSVHSSSNDHGIAGTIGLTGSDSGSVSLGGQTKPGQLLPTHGSIVSRTLGFSQGLPRFLTLGGKLHQGHRPITGEGGGTLGPLHDPFRLDYHPDRGVEIPDLELIDGLTPSGIGSRAQLLRQMDQLAQRIEKSPGIQRMDRFYQQAAALLTDPAARSVFDLEREPDSVRRRFGRFRFGQCCLLARRLVEHGARFVQVNWSSHVEPVEDTGDGGWDMHDRHFQQYQDRHAWMLDQALSALLDDLEERGMLKDTAVVAMGEFGRTPRINAKAGRDHWQQCYSGLLAGGGLQAGQVIGSSDARGEHPLSRPVAPADVFATVLQTIGIGTTELTSNGLLPLGEAIEELL